jgi:hypothetical protein
MVRPRCDTPLVPVCFSGQQYVLWAETPSLFIFWDTNILMGRAWAETLALLGPGTGTITSARKFQHLLLVSQFHIGRRQFCLGR